MTAYSLNVRRKAKIQTSLSDSLFLDAAIEIGNLLIDLSITNRSQASWKVPSNTKKPLFSGTDLYTGGSGIGLFFLELYRHTHREMYLSLARKAIRTAYRKAATEQTYTSFVCGRLGIAYALIKLYEITNTSLYRNQALALVKSCRNAYSTSHEYLGGNAGILLCLLHIHTICKEAWLLEMVNDYTEHILQGIHQGPVGVYWDRNPFEVRPLCGFSHGVAGVGFVLLELGRYLKNPAFYTIAEQAFAYENAYFSKEQKNWPDFRLDMWKSEKVADMEAAYIASNLDIFSKTHYMLAWCHGAPGIGLSRIAAYQLTGKQTYLRDVGRAIRITKSKNPSDNFLCHGFAGNLEIFIESYLAFGRPKDWEHARTLGEQLLKRWKKLFSAIQNDRIVKEQLDPSLFLGAAGIGYSLLRLHNPHLTSSILAPHVTGTLAGKIGVKLSALRITNAKVQALLAKEDSKDSDSVRRLKHRMIAQYPSNGLLYIKYRLAQKSTQQLLRLTNDLLLDHLLKLDLDCIIHMESANQGVLLRYNIKGIEESRISRFCYIVLTAFEKPQKVQDVIAAISTHYGLRQPQQRELLQTKIIEQIRQALYAQILVAGK